MGRYATDTGNGDFQEAPAGTHISRCIRMIDLGTQTGEYQGKQTVRNQLLVSWELCNEMMDTSEGGKPFIVSKFYTNSLNEKAALRKDLITWRGRDFTEAEMAKFDLQSILGAQCMLSVVHNEKGRAKVSAVMKMPKGQEAPAPYNTPFAFWLDEFDQATFDGLSDGIKSIIQKSPEFQDLGKKRSQPSQAGNVEEMTDDIPF